MGFFYCFEFSISRKCLGFFYFRTKFGILAWVLLVNLSKNLTWVLLVNLTKNAQIFPALRAESVGVLLLFCEISPKKVGVLLLKEGVFILNTPVGGQAIEFAVDFSVEHRSFLNQAILSANSQVINL